MLLILYMIKKGTTVFKNWTELIFEGISAYTHAQGITQLDKDNYILPVANYFLDPNNSNKLTLINGGKIEIVRKKTGFDVITYETIKFPQSNLSVVTSAADNNVVGIFESGNLQTAAFQATTNL